MIKNLPEFEDIVNPYAIRFDKRYLPKQISKKNGVSRFLFVRNPYNRLISGYVDKLLAPNPIYWKAIGVPAIRNTRQKPDLKSIQCGHDLQFHEYVEYVIKAMDPKQKGAKVDGHFDRMTTLCKPCGVNYEFVGKMESFAEDSLELARRLKLSNQTINLLEAEGGRLSWLDAVKDTAHQPFDKKFRKDYIHCISFYEALNRSWKKMQIRGIIGRQNFPLKESQENTLTEEQFVRLAVEARDKSTSEERKQLQREHFLQMYSKVSKPEFEMIRRIYEADFRLFEYDDKPEILFGDKKIK
ncbi:carbohydrate sulfotransferase 14-like [Mercenaria mercenaria]|uniref:carbohydrate sulfotransferase 14-like n=1 Tax=Mercenaria mercenaria TaxID=6596 RepID=UPI001E1DDC84|nr:carbohydrate sulfotransferase 14-like [Mercenaria mercenaria]